MRIFPALSLAFCALASLSACRATNSVELFRVNDNGEVVNIGRGSDYDHIIYGHFRSASAYDRAFVTVQSADSADNSVCYVKINNGQVNNGVGEGIRIAPCNNAKLVNEVAVANGLDGIGIYDLTKAPWGTYVLYFYDGSAFRSILETPFFDEHLNAGLDAFRVNPENHDEAFITYSHKDKDGNIGISKQTVAIRQLLSGNAYQIRHAQNTNAAGGPIPAPAKTGLTDNSDSGANSAENITDTNPAATNSDTANNIAENSNAVNPDTANNAAENTNAKIPDPDIQIEETVNDAQAVTPNGDPIPAEALKSVKN